MATSLKINQITSARVAKNSAVFSAEGSLTTATFGAVSSRIQIVGTSAELLNLGDLVGTPTLLVIKHSDTSNFVEVALDSGMTKKIAKIIVGRFAVFAPTTGTLYIRANTAPVNVLVFATGV